MSFSSNPLSLGVTHGAFDSWLRDSGYLEILDHRTSDLHSQSSAAPSATGFLSRIWALFSILTLNPFAKLRAADFSGPTPSWTCGFDGFFDSYSFPSSPAQARLRVHENAKRYAPNYASLFLLFFLCALLQAQGYRFAITCSEKSSQWGRTSIMPASFGISYFLDVRFFMLVLAAALYQSIPLTVIILIFSNFQMAILCALSIGYAGMILHAAFRKLTLAKPPSTGSRK